MKLTNMYYAIGLMSGSSLDGLDIAYCLFKLHDDKWSFEIIETETFSYDKNLQQKLLKLYSFSAKELMLQDAVIAKLWSGHINTFISKHQIKRISFIASHGHTVFHEPQNSFTTQIGNGAAIAALTGVPVVCDFRSTDVALGGQGAPLVPIGDLLLFDDYDGCLNLGGICNISLKSKNELTAFDIAPCNQVLNFFANESGKEFDLNGDIARNGKVNKAILKELNSLEFYKQGNPKSLSNDFSKVLLQILNQEKSTENKLRTAVEHIAIQIAESLNQSNNSKNNKCLATGGGALNTFLIETIQSKTEWKLVVPDKKLVNFKEALIFAFLGVLRWRNETNIYKKITGASADSCSGCIYLA